MVPNTTMKRDPGRRAAAQAVGCIRDPGLGTLGRAWRVATLITIARDLTFTSPPAKVNR